MQAYFLRAPSWVIAVIAGGAFAVMVVVVGWVQGDIGRFEAIAALVGGTLFGVTLTLATRSQRREQLRAVEQLPQSEWKQVRRAAWRGPVPSDPQIRAAALDLANQFFSRIHRFRWFLSIVFGLNLVIAIVNLVISGGFWFVVLAAAWVVGLVSHWYNYRRLQRRIEILQPES